MVMRRQTVGAHYGLTDWLAQRVTAIVMYPRNELPYAANFMRVEVKVPQLPESVAEATLVSSEGETRHHITLEVERRMPAAD